jgi:hypothetical protein
MPTVTGKGDVRRFIAGLPADLESKVLRGAARAGGKVVADEIKARTPSDAVRESVRIRTQLGTGRVVVKIDVKPGWARSVGTWLEYGTDPHFITVDESQRDGMSASRINKMSKAGSLVIGGKFVGTTVFHPGARPQPTFRPALDAKEDEAVAAAQAYINSRVTRNGIVGAPDAKGDEE